MKNEEFSKRDTEILHFSEPSEDILHSSFNDYLLVFNPLRLLRL